MTFPRAWLLVLFGSLVGYSLAATPPAFTAADDGGFTFDTGTVRGRLRAGGKSLGLTEVTHVPTGLRLDRSNGLLSHYRVFTRGKRYGGGAWDWPATARLDAGGAVAVHWDAAPDRLFTLEATYRWVDDHTIDLETTVGARAALPGFESFLASYFAESFTNALVQAESGSTAGPPLFLAALPAEGDWQMFPRDEAAVKLIQDGRWKLPPNPVEWRIRPRFARPLAFRRAPAVDLLAAFMAPEADCFAIAMPQQTEGHYSLYFCLFGRDLKAGETARARTRLHLGPASQPADMLASWKAFRGD